MTRTPPLAAFAIGLAIAVAAVGSSPLVAAAAAGGNRPGHGPARKQQLEGASEHTYKTIGSATLRLFVFEPPRVRPGENRPAIVLFHGASGKPGMFARQCRYFASRGMVAITAGRRERSSTLDKMKDGKSAMRWVRAHAAELGIDPRRIACGGGSEGGGIALATALSTRINNEGDDLSISPVPGALVLFNPGMGVSDDPKENDKVSLKPGDLSLIGDGNHLRNLTADAPPMIIFHGTADKIVPFASVARFARRAQSLGVRCVLVPYEGRGHSFYNEGRAFGDVLKKADRFLTELGYLKPR